MTTISAERIAALLAKRDDLSAQLASGDLPRDTFVALSKEYAEVEPVAAAAGELQRLRDEFAGLEEMLDDPEMREMAQEEADAIRETLPAAERALALSLLPRDAADERSAMLEVRAGTGGDEAALFAGDLFRMYSRYAEEKGWKIELISASAADMGGYKEVVAAITGKGVFAQLKFESGVHRVQRVPTTESGGRIHTSAATVAVLPEAEDVDIQIEDKDLRIDIYRSSGPGGQSVNTTDSAVRIVHIPTGLVVIQQDEKSQHKNRAKALRVLRTRLYELERERLHSERAGARKSMVGSGDRSERIRTYNFPQGRVTDHRINLTLHRLPEILEGQLDELLRALNEADEAERLAGLDEQYSHSRLREGLGVVMSSTAPDQEQPHPRPLPLAGGEKVRTALTNAAALLVPVSDTPRLDAELLMAHALGVSRETMLLGHLDHDVPDGFGPLLARRQSHEPLAYITGTRDFWTISVSVAPGVLIPRADSETLIEAAVGYFGADGPKRILDLGTGSGALLLAALSEWPHATGLGVDASHVALAIAQANASRLGLADRSHFLNGNWAEGIEECFSLILCNPPYVETGASLSAQVRDFEPTTALFAGVDGLDAYRVLIPQLPERLAPGGMIALEIGSAQAASVADLFRVSGLHPHVRQDLGGRDRAVLHFSLGIGQKAS